MKILLDNCVDRRLGGLLAGHEVIHTSRIGLSTASNGDLIKAAAERGFDVLMTVDQKIRHEQRLGALAIPVLELNTRDSRLPALTAMAPHFEKALAATRSHRFISLDKNGNIEFPPTAPV